MNKNQHADPVNNPQEYSQEYIVTEAELIDLIAAGMRPQAETHHAELTELDDKWQEGDLLIGKDGTRALVLWHVASAADGSLYELVTEKGENRAYNGGSEPVDVWQKSHDTGLRYWYQTRYHVRLDFKKGFFTPYVEIL